jgi:multiple sugar transport system permease protein
VVVEFVLGFALALVMHRALYLRKSVRTAILVPYGIITVVSAYAWQYAFTPAYGFVNPLFGSDLDWFGQTVPSLVVICLSEIWKTTPFMSLLLLAGLAQIPSTYIEAAQVDGATAWQRFRKVIVPNMKGAIMVALLFRTLDAFRIFDNVFIMTQGANGTETLSFLAYRQTITRVMIGLGSAPSSSCFTPSSRWHGSSRCRSRPATTSRTRSSGRRTGASRTTPSCSVPTCSPRRCATPSASR